MSDRLRVLDFQNTVGVGSPSATHSMLTTRPTTDVMRLEGEIVMVGGPENPKKVKFQKLTTNRAMGSEN